MFLGSRPIIVSDISFIIQVIAFTVLVYSITKVRRDLPGHGRFATFSLSLSLLSILYMIYSSVRGFSANLPADMQFILLIHKLLGFIATILGILFAFNQWKWKVKKNMVVSLVAWSGALALGIFVFVTLFIG